MNEGEVVMILAAALIRCGVDKWFDLSPSECASFHQNQAGVYWTQRTLECAETNLAIFDKFATASVLRELRKSSVAPERWGPGRA